ncbi:hypothetical protein M011DRAFT_417155 [Sporormia fimetaria CBS 119925]|uniref:Uncharacterized protein n=1 Tax=Sporormia fimetaria CBS 119925 TaxID=1340428 RepID=A0A6A6VMN9_9PLEO|nr:hypothetical protein M011DRAFT_417155 [Sporormia fimetaria CBS 119925]
MAHLKSEDTAWAVSELPTWQYAIYSVDDPFSSLHTFLDKGKEAIAYLTYIIDHYDSLPSTIVFLHAHRSRWPQARHNEGAQCSAVQMLRDLNIDYIHKEGYANLRCNTNPGCPDEIQPFREPKEDRRAAENAMADAWRELFPGNDMHVPVVIATPCGAQFAVSKVQVRKRPRDDYVRFREWVVNTTVEDPGRVMEYLWHVIFGREAVHCPDQRKC